MPNILCPINQTILITSQDVINAMIDTDKKICWKKMSIEAVSMFHLNPKQTKGEELTLFYTGSRIYVITQGGVQGTPLAKCSLRQPICMLMAKNGSQYKILVFSSPQVPKMVTFDDYFCCERPRNEVGNRLKIHSKKVKIRKF